MNIFFLDEYQLQAQQFAKYPNRLDATERMKLAEEFDVNLPALAAIIDLLYARLPIGLTYAVLALTGESGELANKLKKAIRAGEPTDRYVLADELGDVLWYVAAVAKELNFSLSEIAGMNIEKLQERREQTKVTG